MDYKSTCEINDSLNSLLITIIFIILISAVGQLRLKKEVSHVLKQVKISPEPRQIKMEEN